ncbi:MAG: hypothetical protein HOQ24_16420 [Mycobacteriaceae bacterium]|nr:hypothetical protein [Mycobacteriaceae bacterium]
MARWGGIESCRAAVAAAALSGAVLVAAAGPAAAEGNKPPPPVPPRPSSAPAIPITPSALRFGDLVVALPPFVPAEPVRQVNTASAANEAQIVAHLRSVGVAPRRAESMAAAMVGGAVGGAVIACVAGGAVLWMFLGVFSIPLLPFDCAKDIVLGGAAGALIGAAVGAARPLPPS